MGKQLSFDFDGDDDFDLDNDLDNDAIPNDVRIINLLRQIYDSQLAMPDRLWTLQDCARYFRTSEATARRVLQQPGTPISIRLPTQRESKMPPRYLAEEIMAYATRKARQQKTRLR